MKVSALNADCPHFSPNCAALRPTLSGTVTVAYNAKLAEYADKLSPDEFLKKTNPNLVPNAAKLGDILVHVCSVQPAASSIKRDHTKAKFFADFNADPAAANKQLEKEREEARKQMVSLPCLSSVTRTLRGRATRSTTRSCGVTSTTRCAVRAALTSA